MDRVENQTLSMDEAAARLSEACRYNSAVRWWGSASELISGEHEFARQTRHHWRLQYGKLPTDDAAISQEDVKDFISAN